MILNCYVDDETMARLRVAARDRTDMTFPTDADLDAKVIELAENAISETALADWKGRQR